MVYRRIAVAGIVLTCVLMFGCKGEDEESTASLAAPTDLHLLSMGTTSVQMQWTDNASDEEAYYVERSPASNQSYQEVASLPANSVTFGDTDLISGATYFYRVRAGRDSARSSYSNEIEAVAVSNAPPQSPSVVFPSNGATSISLSPTLRWTANDADGDPLRFDVYFGRQSNPAIVSSNLTEPSLQRTGLDGNATYYWKIVVKDTYFETSGPVWMFRTGIGGPSVSVTYPNGGEQLFVGASPTILWASDQLVGTVDILLSADGGNDWLYVVASNVTNTGSLVWPLTEAYGPLCRLRIQSTTNPAVHDDSNGDFAVLAPPWMRQNSGTNAILSGITFVDANSGWAVGDGGTIVHTSNGGASWAEQSSGTTVSLNSVAFVDANNGWVVGWNGTMLHTSNGGARWAGQSSGTSEGLNGVTFVDVNNGWAVGDIGRIVHTSNGGTSWVRQYSGTTASLKGVAFADANNGWAVGGFGNIRHTSNGGQTWTVQSSGTTWEEDVEAVAFVDANNGWVVGRNGKILHTSNSGERWATQSSGTTEILWSVAFVDASNGWAVGWNGTILHTSNGGARWAAQTSGTTASLWGVAFVDANNGWAVGWGGRILHTSTSGE